MLEPGGTSVGGRKSYSGRGQGRGGPVGAEVSVLCLFGVINKGSLG